MRLARPSAVDLSSYGPPEVSLICLCSESRLLQRRTDRVRGLEDQIDLLEVATEMNARSARSTGAVHTCHSPSLGFDEREVDDDNAQGVK